MADVKVSGYFFAILAFTVVIVGGTAMLGELFRDTTVLSSDPKFSEFNSSFNKLADITATTGELESQVSGASDSKFDVFGVLGALMNQAWQVLTLMFTSLDFMTSAWNGLLTVFGVPSWIPLIIGSAIVVLIAFAVFGAIFQRDM